MGYVRQKELQDEYEKKLDEHKEEKKKREEEHEKMMTGLGGEQGGHGLNAGANPMAANPLGNMFGMGGNQNIPMPHEPEKPVPSELVSELTDDDLATQKAKDLRKSTKEEYDQEMIEYEKE